MTQLNVSPFASLQEAKTAAKLAIDEEADKARQRYVSVGILIDQEYKLTEQQAESFKAGGYSGNAPQTVDTWRVAGGFASAQQAADDILTTRDQWVQLLMAIRDIRLNGKAIVENETKVAGVIATRNVYIGYLQGV